MAGSGLKDVLCEKLAANSLDKMLTGHAYSQAVRGYLLVQLVLGHIVLEGADVSEEERRKILTMLIAVEEFTADKNDGCAFLLLIWTEFHNYLETL